MTDTITVYVPRETTAVSLGADEVAEAIAALAKKNKVSVDIVRNGSWGMCWLEPLIEVVSGDERIGYGPVYPDAVDSLFAADFLHGGEHELRQGPVTQIPYLKKQDRWTFRRCGLIDPLSVDEYEEHGGFAGLRKAFADGADAPRYQRRICRLSRSIDPTRRQ